MRHSLWVLLLCVFSHADQPFVRSMPYGEYELYVSEDAVKGDRIAIRPANWFGDGEHPPAVIAKVDDSIPRAKFENGRICIRTNGNSPCAGENQRVEITFGQGTLGWLQVAEKKDRILIGDTGADTPHSSILLHRPANSSRQPASE